jgi:hypothetical protein
MRSATARHRLEADLFLRLRQSRYLRYPTRDPINVPATIHCLAENDAGSVGKLQGSGPVHREHGRLVSYCFAARMVSLPFP